MAKVTDGPLDIVALQVNMGLIHQERQAPFVAGLPATPAGRF